MYMTLDDDKVPEKAVPEGPWAYRDSAWQLFLRRAERLEQRAMGYRAIAHLIKTGGLTEAEEKTVWSVGAFRDD